MSTIRKHWHWIFAGGIFFFEALLLLVLGDNIYVGICDNLDLFITQLKMLADNQAFFAQNVQMPILSEIDRDYFPTEFSVYNLLYLLLPDVYAYIAGYLLKVLLAFTSSIMLAKLLLGDNYHRYEKVVVLVAAAFALLPLYPMYAMCFASLPLLLYLLIHIYKRPVAGWYIALFCYPLVSYFSFFGVFILGYLLIAIVIMWICDKKFPFRLLGAVCVLALGYVCMEYRLFRVMLLSDTETIRSTMIIASDDISLIWSNFTDSFLHGVSHAESIHTYFVLPVCVVYFFYCNIGYIRKKEWRRLITEPFNLTVLFIVFNCAVYAVDTWQPFHQFIENILPPLTGFQFGRTIFFNAFAWYIAFFLVLKRVYESNRWIACAIGLIAVLVVGGTQCEYSDVYNTVYCNLYKLVKHTQTNQLSYGEFYGQELFELVKEEIDYDTAEGVCAYGFHPAQLSYNGFSTTDGYCGYYSEDYKQQFREVIAPTLEVAANWQSYYDDWGCRAYLFSSDGENTYDYGENASDTPREILIDVRALAELGCSYIFSRTEITNATQEGLALQGTYEYEGIPYKVYVYRLGED